jgi:hypothetical protein
MSPPSSCESYNPQSRKEGSPHHVPITPSRQGQPLRLSQLVATELTSGSLPTHSKKSDFVAECENWNVTLSDRSVSLWLSRSGGTTLWVRSAFHRESAQGEATLSIRSATRRRNRCPVSVSAQRVPEEMATYALPPERTTPWTIHTPWTNQNRRKTGRFWLNAQRHMRRDRRAERYNWRRAPVSAAPINKGWHQWCPEKTRSDSRSSGGGRRSRGRRLGRVSRICVA